ncbi:hypothetical protein UlMin_019554 [Ulmus minor]
MKINVKETTIVKPAEKTPRHTIWLSSLDLVNKNVHSTALCFYRYNGASNFFDTALLKEALSKVLVPFYPFAGRFKHDENGRLEINCNEEGVLFVEAETCSNLDDLGDFMPSPALKKLITTVDQSGGVSSFPFMVVQLTRFKCGGVSLLVSAIHLVADGSTAFHFMASFAEITRGLDISIPPFLDRSLLRPRNPPQVMFDHIEYKNFSTITKKPSNPNGGPNFEILNLRMEKEQASILKRKAKEGSNTNYSTFEILAGHIWKCTCKARAQPHDEETSLFFTVNGRFNRLKPQLPPGFSGNVNYAAVAVSLVGDIVSKPVWYAANLVHETLVRMDNDYLRSAIDYLESQPDLMAIKRINSIYECPNLGITSWVRLPTHEADFGWGRPFHTTPASIMCEGKSCVLPSATDDGSLSLAIALRPEHMKEFEKVFYEY